MPRLGLYLCSAERDAPASRVGGGRMPATTPIRAAAADLETLHRLDTVTVGVSRQKHHRYLLGDPATTGVFLHEGQECIGYAYISATGHVGPLAVLDERHMPEALGTALVIAAGRAARASVFVPAWGPALEATVGRGLLRIQLPMVLMAEHDGVDWARYLPRNPGFM